MVESSQCAVMMRSSTGVSALDTHALSYGADGGSLQSRLKPRSSACAPGDRSSASADGSTTGAASGSLQSSVKPRSSTEALCATAGTSAATPDPAASRTLQASSAAKATSGSGRSTASRVSVSQATGSTGAGSIAGSGAV